MNVQVMKTKAEQTLAESFHELASRLPGNAEVAEARRQAIGRFAALGLPHRRVEEWKYTDLRSLVREALPLALADGAPATEADIAAALGPLAALDALRIVLVNGSYRKALSHVAGAGGLDVQSLGSLLQAGRGGLDGALDTGRESDAVLALNMAYMTDGAVVRIADGAQLDKPLLLVFLRAGSEPRLAATRNVIRAGKGARATIVEVFVDLPGASPEGQWSTATDMVVGDGAEVAHVKYLADSGKVTHLANWITKLGAGASYKAFQFTAGAGLARNQIAIAFDGEDTKLDLSGAFLGRGKEHVDTTLVVDHAVPGCESRELFKGVLDNSARGVFQGKIIVRPDAQKTDGKQMAQALMLSPDAEFDSKPELEIYADDVVCGHGSTAAQLDDDLLFYCRARGIPLEEARALMTEAFIGEAIDKVEHEGLREALMGRVRAWLAGT